MMSTWSAKGWTFNVKEITYFLSERNLRYRKNEILGKRQMRKSFLLSKHFCNLLVYNLVTTSIEVTITLYT